jgi:DNA sulfur modification protein DndD
MAQRTYISDMNSVLGARKSESETRAQTMGKYEIADFKLRKHQTISLKIGELEKIITQMYHTLANKDDMVKQIKITPETFATELVGFDGNIVDKGHMSVGEKEIYALSVLWGLAKISNRKIPMIIDSPLAKLDNAHVDKIIKNFFPNAADQVIILSHDREIDQVLYNKLEPYINRAYRLSVSEVDKIEDGYFFGGGEVNAS